MRMNEASYNSNGDFSTGEFSNEDEDEYEYEYNSDDNEDDYGMDLDQDGSGNEDSDGDDEVQQGADQEQDSASQNSDNISLEMEDVTSSSHRGNNNNNNNNNNRRRRHSSSGSARNLMINRHLSENTIRMISTKEMIPVMKKKILDISDILAVPSSAAQPLLRRHKWAKERLIDKYTNDEEKELKEAGVYARCTKQLKSIQDKDTTNTTITRSASNKLVTCNICFDDVNPKNMFSMPCEHEFCTTCWERHIATKLEEGPGSILATCPQVGCKEVITEEDVASVAKNLSSKFENYQLRNFVDLNGTSRWCPGAGCERIAALTKTNCNLSDADSMNVTCDECATCFCIKCGEEPHQPLRCAVLDNWKEKCRNESETANWILANTKACPKCHSRIEKNQGCNHMTCQNCKHEFCWICSGDWKEHGANTGGYYSCNKFNDKSDGEDQSSAALAKKELDRYLHYYKRYHAHAGAQKFAMKQLSETETKMKLLQECKQDVTWSDVEFLKTANEQLVECRRVLKFTFVFAYYMTTPITAAAVASSSDSKGKAKSSKKKSEKGKNGSGEDEVSAATMANKATTEEERKREAQKNIFEDHQERLERYTEILSEMVEKPLKEINRTDVVNQTRVTEHFMKEILKYFEDECF